MKNLADLSINSGVALEFPQALTCLPVILPISALSRFRLNSREAFSPFSATESFF
jgi:hypothetical protein